MFAMYKLIVDSAFANGRVCENRYGFVWANLENGHSL